MELYSEPVSGFRSWQMKVGDSMALHGLVYSEPPWSPDEDLEARCRKSSELKARPHELHSSPHDMKCLCGYHAWWAYGDVRSSTLCFTARPYSVRGAVIGWGRIIIGETGWRAQYARPIALLHWPERPSSAVAGAPTAERVNDHFRQVAKRYHIPCVDTVEELEAIAAASGSPIPKEAPCQSSEPSSSPSS